MGQGFDDLLAGRVEQGLLGGPDVRAGLEGAVEFGPAAVAIPAAVEAADFVGRVIADDHEGAVGHLDDAIVLLEAGGFLGHGFTDGHGGYLRQTVYG